MYIVGANMYILAANMDIYLLICTF